MYNYGPRNPRKRVEILNEIDVSKQQRYKSAVLIEVAGGRGDFYRRGSSARYCIMLEERPLCEVCLREDECPAILPILRDKPEKGILALVEHDMQRLVSTELSSYVEAVFPLLASLEDGYYAIVDTLLYPANGNEDYFYSLDGATDLEALGDPPGIKPSPAYIFPTEVFPENMNEYRPSPTTKAIAYYIQGYMTLLLSGHELAVAASVNGEFLSAMVIVPCTNKTESGSCFADLFVPKLHDANCYHIIQSSYHRTKAAVKGINSSHCDMQYRSLWQQYPLVDKKHDIAFGRMESTPTLLFKHIGNQEKYPHYKGIMSVQVKNGKRKLIKKGYNGFYQLMLHDKPLVQVYEHWTSGKPCIAPAFRVAESCNEIQQAVEGMSKLPNQSIQSYAKALSPILELLADGTYVIVDTTVYPSTGNSFFWEVPNRPTIYRSLEESNLCFPSPAYIYPTLHPGCWEDSYDDAVNTALILEEHNPGRAICIYLQGYMSALLYGHSMAAMAAYSHKPLPALVIIPYSQLIANNDRETIGRFADVAINIEATEGSNRVREMLEYRRVPVIKRSSDWDEKYLDSWKHYPTPDQLMSDTKHY